MFDTAAVAVEGVELDTSRFNGWQEFINLDKGRTRHVYKLAREGFPVVRYTLETQKLWTESSLPKIGYGSNARLLMPGDVPMVLDSISNYVSDAVRGDIPHVGTWNIAGRLDPVFAWRLGGRANVYLDSLATRKLPYHFVQRIGGTTVIWRNTRRAVVAYLKGAEMHSSEHTDMLRLEVQSHRPRFDFRRAGADIGTANETLKWGNAEKVIRYFLDQLGGGALSVSDEDALFNALLSQCKPTTAARLWNYLKLLSKFGRDGLLARGFSSKWIARHDASIRTLANSLSAGGGGLLPELRAPEDYTGEPLLL